LEIPAEMLQAGPGPMNGHSDPNVASWSLGRHSSLADQRHWVFY
jgi:hypothetical protein